MNESRKEWRNGVHRLHDEAAGLLTVDLMTPMAVADLWIAAASGDYDACRNLRAVEQTLQRVRRAPRHSPALCVCCPRPVRRLSSEVIVGIATPAVDSPTQALGFVLCPKCAAAGDVMIKAREGLSRIWPDVRPVAVTHPNGGHA